MIFERPYSFDNFCNTTICTSHAQCRPSYPCDLIPFRLTAIQEVFLNSCAPYFKVSSVYCSARVLYLIVNPLERFLPDHIRQGLFTSKSNWIQEPEERPFAQKNSYSFIYVCIYLFIHYFILYMFVGKFISSVVVDMICATVWGARRKYFASALITCRI